jgi:RNA polymerase sigma factor (TIGR02999 family)
MEFSTAAMSQPVNQPVNELIAKWAEGDQQALNALVPLIYKELHSLAHWYLAKERSGHTLQTTALVNEAYMRMAQQGPFQTQDRQHLIAITARLMRQILVDYARSHRADKRGADLLVSLADGVDVALDRGTDVIAVDDALTQLSRLDPQQALLVELRFFGGMTLEEASAVLGISTSTAKREWNMAKAWLTRELRKGNHGTSGELGKG